MLGRLACLISVAIISKLLLAVLYRNKARLKKYQQDYHKIKRIGRRKISKESRKEVERKRKEELKGNRP
jgi:hypothetical protein